MSFKRIVGSGFMRNPTCSCSLSFDSSRWDTVLLSDWPCCCGPVSCRDSAREYCVTTVTNRFQGGEQSQTPPSTRRFKGLLHLYHLWVSTAILPPVPINIRNFMAAKSHLVGSSGGTDNAVLGQLRLSPPEPYSEWSDEQHACIAETFILMLLGSKLKRSHLGSRWPI